MKDKYGGNKPTVEDFIRDCRKKNSPGHCLFDWNVESAARKRQTRALASLMAERLRKAVIGAEELKEQYLFGPRQWLKLIGFLAAKRPRGAASSNDLDS